MGWARNSARLGVLAFGGRRRRADVEPQYRPNRAGIPHKTVCGCTVCMCAQCARVHGCAMLCGCTVFLSIHYSYRLAFRSARRGGAPHRDRCRWLSRLLWLRCAVVAIGATPKRPSTVDCRCTTTCSQRSETGTAQHQTRLARRRTPPHETGASRRSVA